MKLIVIDGVESRYRLEILSVCGLRGIWRSSDLHGGHTTCIYKSQVLFIANCNLPPWNLFQNFLAEPLIVHRYGLAEMQRHFGMHPSMIPLDPLRRKK